MIEHSFQVNEIYWDSKRKAYCELVNMMPYKQRSKGHYVDFRYDNGQHVRKPLHEAIKRFIYAEFKTNETQNEVLEKFAALPEWTGTMDIPTGLGKTGYSKDFFIQDEVVAMSPVVAKTLNTIFGHHVVRIKYDNVIYVDFINKVIIE